MGDIEPQVPAKLNQKQPSSKFSESVANEVSIFIFTTFTVTEQY
jgi:hypothetical protein